MIDRRRKLCIIGLPLLLLLTSCATVIPALRNLALAFAEDLIASASVNYSPRYATQVESLLTALLNDTTGLGVQGRLARTGYEAPPPDYARDERRNGYGDRIEDDYYADSSYGDGYPSGAGNYESEGIYVEPDYGDASANDYEDPYGPDPGYDDPYGPDPGYDDGYGSEPPPPGDPGYGDAGQPGYAVATAGGIDPGQFPVVTANAQLVLRGVPKGAIVLDASILKRDNGGLTAIADGAVLQDGNGDPSRGDLLRFRARTNCDCWLYVVGIDATGYVAQIFPDPQSGLDNPVVADREYLFPAGSHWWGLDDQPGVEHVYFVASAVPRPDIAEVMAELGRTARAPQAAEIRPVRSPAVMPTRGLVRIEAEPVRVDAGGVGSDVVPDRFASSVDGQALTVTRWFHHQ